jgi:hypothetical protein
MVAVVVAVVGRPLSGRRKGGWKTAKGEGAETVPERAEGESGVEGGVDGEGGWVENSKG